VSATPRQLAWAAGGDASPAVVERARALGIGLDEVVFRVSAEGFKGPPLAEERALPRILAVGDSCTFGSPLDYFSYPRALERELTRLGTPAEVVNAGVPGYSPAHVLARIDELAALRPEQALICIGWNALGGQRYAPTTLLERTYALRMLRAIAARWLTRGAEPVVAAEELAERPQRPDPDDPEIGRLSRYRPPFLDEVRRIGETLRARGSRVFILTLPSLYLSGERPTPEALAIGVLPRFTDNPYVLAALVARYNQLLREMADQSGFEVIDLSAWSRETLRPRHAYFASAAALNEIGQERMGQRIAARLHAELAGASAR
jgi:hypothetical protein